MIQKEYTFVFDLDMCLTSDSNSQFFTYLLEEKNMQKKEYNSIKNKQKKYDIANIYHASGKSMLLTPMPGAYEMLSKIKRNFNCKLMIKTDRNVQYAKEHTEAFVEKHYFGIFDHIELTAYDGIVRIENKADFCKRVGADTFTDDHWGHVSKTARLLPDTKSLLYTQDINKNISSKDFLLNIERVENWNDIYEQILSHISCV